MAGGLNTMRSLLARRPVAESNATTTFPAIL
jgi:hypothetical protein